MGIWNLFATSKTFLNRWPLRVLTSQIITIIYFLGAFGFSYPWKMIELGAILNRFDVEYISSVLLHLNSNLKLVSFQREKKFLASNIRRKSSVEILIVCYFSSVSDKKHHYSLIWNPKRAFRLISEIIDQWFKLLTATRLRVQ